MRNLIIVRFLIHLLVLFFYLSYSSYSQTAEEIIKKAEEMVKGETSTGTFTMTVVNPDFKRTVVMESWWVGNDKALIIIKSPAKEAGNKTLKIKNEMWNYLKNTETTIKIPPSMMLQSWNGSDLTNDDLVRESNLVDDYNIKFLFEEKIQGEDCWKIELKPKPTAPVVWGTIYYWVRKTDYLPALIQHFDEKGNLYRTMSFRDYKIMDKRKIPTKWTITNHKKPGHYTEFIYNDVKFNVNIPDKIFSFKEFEK